MVWNLAAVGRGGTSAVAAYQIERSLRFNSADSAMLHRTPAAGNRTTWTYSGWIKRAAISTNQSIFADYVSASTYGVLNFLATDVLEFQAAIASVISRKASTALFRDPSAWYHIVLAHDTTNATANNRYRLYVNGVEITDTSANVVPAINLIGAVNSTTQHTIGQYASGSYFNGYMTEVNFIDGLALDPSSFGETDATTGVWGPKAYSGSYGANGFYLKFDDNSNTTAATLGHDDAPIDGTHTTANNWTPTNFSVAAGGGNDSLVDTPTNYGTDTGAGGEVRGNYCTWNPIWPGASAPVNGNLDSPSAGIARGTLALLSVDAYWEVTSTGGTSTAGTISDAGTANTTTIATTKTYGFRLTTAGALDYKNITDAGAWTAITTGLTGVLYPYTSGAASTVASLNAGQRAFAATAPSGFKALCTQNMASAPTPALPATFTGNGSAAGPFVYASGVVSTVTINGNVATRGTHFDGLSNGIKLRTASASYNTAGSNTVTAATYGASIKYSRGQGNP